MREWLEKANAMNPQAKLVCGFQPAFLADYKAINIILSDSMTADEFDLVYETDAIAVYQYANQFKYRPFMLFDIKYIADLVGFESWIVVQGLIAATHADHVIRQANDAKRMLIKAIWDIWGIDLQKKGA